MLLTIDNNDGAGARDYTAAIAPEAPPRVRRKLNQPSELEAALIADTAQFVVPVLGGRVVLSRRDGVKLFTGYLAAAPVREHLGWGERGPVLRYRLAAGSDEFILDRKMLPERAPFVNRTAGSSLKQLAEDLLPGAFNTSAVDDLDTQPLFASDSDLTFSQQAAALALRARASYRAHDAALRLKALGATSHTVSESAAAFTPGGLRLARLPQLVNDATVSGRVEPRAYVKDYFLGDGLTLQFDLSHQPFTRNSQVLVDEEYKGSSLRATHWKLTAPSGGITVGSGRLNVNGGTGTDGATRVEFVEQVELGDALLLPHGEVTFNAASNAAIGGLYNGAVSIANCFAGFRITPSGAQSAIRALVNGVATGPTITTAANHRYALTTRLYATQVYRKQQTFHSSVRSAGNGRGGAAVSADVRVVLEVHDVDPASPGSQGALSTVLYDAIISAAPGFVTYAPVNALSANLSLSFTRLLRAVDAEVRSAIPAQSFRTRLVGTVAEGAECQVLDSLNLLFHPAYVPVANEQVVVRYRSRGRALVRITDPTSIAANAQGSDDGVRADVVRVIVPAPRTAADCENAALALLDDSTLPAWAGEYQVWSDYLPAGAASDVFPGDALVVDAPSRAANLTAIVREVGIEMADPGGERALYKIAFANDAAEPPGVGMADSRLREPLELTATTSTAGSTFIADLPAAEVTTVTSTTVSIDTGVAAPSGGGFEVRRSDIGWGQEYDRNLVGRFTTQSFTVTRLARVVDFYVRQFDNSSPPRYSRYSAALHIDRPL
ncbi:MAG: hypothetical protein L0212_11405 [Acidobacteria bacterium]|nr:hypothetical protein [Acidobacteriota bacterium]